MLTKIRWKRIRSICITLPVVICASWLHFSILPSTASAEDVLIGTGEAGTLSHHTGRAVCRVINRYADGIACTTVQAMDVADNLTNLQGGSLDFCLADLRVMSDAVNKQGNFEFLDIAYDNVAVVVPLYDILTTLVVRNDAGIGSLSDLPGKRINAGNPRSPQRLAIDTIMRAKNWSKNVFSMFQELPVSQSQDTLAFCHGTIQAMVHIGVHPDPQLQQLIKLCPAELVDMMDPDIQKLARDHPAFSMVTIAADVYPSVSTPVTTLGSKMVLAASGIVEEETVYKILKASYAHQRYLTGVHPALSSFSEYRARGKAFGGIKHHPGASRFFAEQGHSLTGD